MGTPFLLLSQRPYSEQRAIFLLRCLAGDGKRRLLARYAIGSAGGDESAVIAIARMVGIALQSGLQFQVPDCIYIGRDEQSILSLIARCQRIAVQHVGATHPDLRDAVNVAALAMRRLGIYLPEITMDPAGRP